MDVRQLAELVRRVRVRGRRTDRAVAEVKGQERPGPTRFDEMGGEGG